MEDSHVKVITLPETAQKHTKIDALKTTWSLKLTEP